MPSWHYAKACEGLKYIGEFFFNVPKISAQDSLLLWVLMTLA